MIDKFFDHAAVEARQSARWEEAGAFRAGRPDRADRDPYCIVIPPPNVTGSLHMGHALNNTLQDILCRFERMRGRDVLWQVGLDHAGIATQMVVERRLAERNIQRRDLERDEFVQHVWEWKEQSGGQIVGQLKRLGASCDWSRERFTMDEGLSRAVLRVFVNLHRDGLVYRDKRLVNWDPHFATAISDLEVQPVEVKGHLWHIRYPLAGEPDRYIEVATTRPETMLGDVAVAVHPDDPRFNGLIGREAVLPLVGRRIRIVADTYSDPEKGTGAVKITPAHDFNDFQVGRRHGLAAINVFGPRAEIRIAGNDAFLDGLEPGADLDALLALEGLDRAEARKRIVEMLEASGALAAVEPHLHSVPHGDRSGVPVEPYLTDQWFVDVQGLARRALAAVRSGETRFVPESWEKTYFQWLENIQPWTVSRQLWWGHRIPAWYGPDGHIFVAETDEEAGAQALAYYVVNGTLSEPEAETLAADPDRLAAFLTRDEDVLDTWFSSALWPFSTLGWPEETPELARYYPTQTLVTGFDIIFFWVARMMMMGLYCTGRVPFDTVYIHALVRDERGAKMSKSKGNVIDPIEVIDKYGADALRFTLSAMAAQGRDIKLSPQRVEGYRNFATKIWNAARFAEMNGCVSAGDASSAPPEARDVLNRWILAECSRAVAEVTRAIEEYRFNDAAGAAYRFTWNTFCDWHLELAKPLLFGTDEPAKAEARRTTAFVFDTVLQLLHPFMPFLTEELWRLRGRDSVLALAPWPDLGEIGAEEAEAEIGWVIALVSEVRSARSELGVAPGAQVPLVLVRPSPATRDRAERWRDTLSRLARLSAITEADKAPGQSVQILVGEEVAALPLAGIVDLAAETERLNREAGKLEAEIAKIDAKLGNESFVARAPEEVVEEQRERRAEAETRRGRIEEALARLRAAA
ncbi:valine--tRNA ligase [Enterovirga sp.]|uniref:valine--tRNA ligase n=1 Tax=Enterovirga sp. TaxID=2026350 RepID=UPI00260212D3|nr:valine--tRNA ligase [Enterovirga sp.]MDB5591668.1 valine--tRNA ligase [Enterovirga sp.]